MTLASPSSALTASPSPVSETGVNRKTPEEVILYTPSEPTARPMNRWIPAFMCVSLMVHKMLARNSEAAAGVALVEGCELGKVWLMIWTTSMVAFLRAIATT